MKKVWVIVECIEYEGSDIWGIFSSKEKAKIELKKIFNKRKYLDKEAFGIDDYNLDKLDEGYE